MKKESKFALGTMFAAGVGYAIGILSAPRSGKRTRVKLAKSANKAKIDSEKQLKKLYKELSAMVSDADKKLKKTKKEAQKSLKKQIDSAKETKQKVKMILSALHDGEADDPDLQEVVVEAKKAKENLAKFLKK
jgi:gas vesicle protein